MHSQPRWVTSQRCSLLPNYSGHLFIFSSFSLLLSLVVSCGRLSFLAPVKYLLLYRIVSYRIVSHCIISKSLAMRFLHYTGLAQLQGLVKCHRAVFGRSACQTDDVLANSGTLLSTLESPLEAPS